jgi:DUF3102 family protein
MSAKPGSNTKRDLTDIAGDIHALERRNVFDIGKLLIEAHAACEHGKWYKWLDHEFAWSEDTAHNYMQAARLAVKSRTVRDLKVPMRTIYDLAEDTEDPDLPAVIEALAKAASKSKKLLSVADAEEIVDLTRLRISFGDYPPATLYALRSIAMPAGCGQGALPEWVKQANERLKEVRPTTDEEAQRIIDACQPPKPEPEVGSDDQDEPDELEPEPEPEPKPKPKTKETSAAEVATAEATRRDIGPLSKAELERLETVIADLTNENSRYKAALAGRGNEIARLESEIKTLKGADLPTLTIDKHIEALAALLKKAGREKRELAIKKLSGKLDLRCGFVTTEAA